jgi:hypothetical protein
MEVGKNVDIVFQDIPFIDTVFIIGCVGPICVVTIRRYLVGIQRDIPPWYSFVL